MQQLQPLCSQQCKKEGHPSGIAARLVEAGNEPQFDGVTAGREHDWNCPSRPFCRERRGFSAGRDDQGHITTYEFGCERRQSIVLPFCPAILDGYILALKITGLAEALTERGDGGRCFPWRPAAKKSDDRQDVSIGLLCVRRERQRDRRAAEQRDELAPFQLSKLHPLPPTKGQSVTDW
jgi:hypothetical protein